MLQNLAIIMSALNDTTIATTCSSRVDGTQTQFLPFLVEEDSESVSDGAFL